jgi:ATP-dependent helicase/nuclease subunit A
VESPEPRAFEESEDAVRVLTLHKSKGLEYGLVVLAGLGLDRRTRQPGVEVRCARPGGMAGARVSVGGRAVKTPRWDEVRSEDEKRLRAEDRRLLYVGATRARRRLVVSWWGDDALGDTLLEPMAFARDTSLFAPGTVEEVTPSPLRLVPVGPRRDEEAVDLAAETCAAEERLTRARATASRKLRRAGEHAFVPARAEDLPASDRGDEEVSDRALRVGVAVHAAMERLLDPGREAPALSAVLEEAAAELPREARGEVKRLVERLLADEVVARARAARRRFVEVPLLFRDGDGALVEGKIDLLFEEGDGLVIVDWKTDRVDSPAALAERTALYAPQLAAYEEGLKKALGPTARIKESRLVFARA